MPYSRNNYSFVIDSNYSPFTMQEMLVPFTMYKDAFEKTEEAYNELSTKAGDFKYLAEALPEGSKSREIYEGYAKDLEAQARDLSQNGLSMGNRRALTELKRRYSGEIGRLEKAKTAMEEERKLRRANKDTSMLYAEDNLNIDQFLDGANPNLYGISGEDLRKEAAQYAAAASSRIYGNTRIQDINKYFQDIIQTQGYSPEVLAAWRQNLEAIQEFKQGAEDIAKARGVDNLTGANHERAMQSIYNGMMEGSVYQEKRTSHQNPGVLTASQALADRRSREQLELSALQSGYVKKNGKWTFDEGEYKKRLKAMGTANSGEEAPEGWELGPDNKWHRKPKETPPKQPKIELRPATFYDEDGNTGPVAQSQVGSSGYGKEISYEEALTKYPNEVAKHDTRKGYGVYYRYYEGTAKGGKKKRLSVIPDETLIKTPVSGTDNPDGEGDDDA